jgi:hypothetical protein
MVDHVEVLVEEPSMEATLRELVPRIVGATSFQIYPFQSKQDLLRKLPDRLRGYSSWLPGNYRVVVIVDRDNDDCLKLKASLEQSATRAGLVTRSRSGGPMYQVVNRIVIEELESWFFGDWDAVCQAYPRMNPHVRSRQGFRNSDQIAGGTWEALQRLLHRAGYYKTGMPKIETAQNIARYMNPDRNQSPSFQCFRTALTEMISCP